MFALKNCKPCLFWSKNIWSFAYVIPENLLPPPQTFLLLGQHSRKCWSKHDDTPPPNVDVFTTSLVSVWLQMCAIYRYIVAHTTMTGPQCRYNSSIHACKLKLCFLMCNTHNTWWNPSITDCAFGYINSHVVPKMQAWQTQSSWAKHYSVSSYIAIYYILQLDILAFLCTYI
jgi:hypothetical protein